MGYLAGWRAKFFPLAGFGMPLLVLVGALIVLSPGGRDVAVSSGSPAARASAGAAAFGRLPLAFEPNRGQFRSGMRYVAHGSGYAVGVTGRGAVLSLRPARDAARSSVRIEFVGGALSPALVAQRRLPGETNYLIGRDRSRWRTHLPTYGQVVARQVWPGVDAVYYGRDGRLEYDFVVAPGTDPGKISLAFRGVRAVRIAGDGALVLRIRGGELRQLEPLAYQRVGGAKQPVRARYTLAHNRVGVVLGRFDRRLPLVIDPALAYATYLGGSGSESCGKNVNPVGGACVAVDSSGHAYITGTTDSTDFPTAHAKQPKNGGNTGNAFVSKLNADGSGLQYSTYIAGSSGYVWNSSIAVDRSGAAYITGDTGESDFPTTPGSLNPSGSGGQDAYLTKLSPDGSRLDYSTYLGNGNTYAYAVTVDSSGHAYVAGWDGNLDFPKPHAGEGNSAFVVKLNPRGSALDYGTALGGTSNGDYVYALALDSGHHVYATGETYSTDFPTSARAFQRSDPNPDVSTPNAFVTKLSATGAVVYSTYLGGRGPDEGDAIAADSSGAAYVTGRTQSTSFPTTPGAHQRAYGGSLGDAFVTKLSPDGSSAEYSTYLGGNGIDVGRGIAVDAARQAFVVGETSSDNLPSTADALQHSLGSGESAFVTVINSSGTALTYSTYFGAETLGMGVAIDQSGAVYFGGNALGAASLSATRGAFQKSSGGGTDAFVAKLFSTPPPPVLGKRATLAPVSGRVLVRLPGTKRFVDLKTVKGIPFGATIDATKGRVQVTAAKRGRGTQSGDFYSGVFQLKQGRDAVVEAALSGSLSGCPSSRKAQAARGKPKKRRLWGNSSRGFRTRGRYGSASVRGTIWLTEDRCDGTFFQVAKGTVFVLDFVRHKTVRITAHHSYLARKR